MVNFPDDLYALPTLPGYFYSPTTGDLYSIKVDGVLKPLKKHVNVFIPALHWKYDRFTGWQISKNNRRMSITESAVKNRMTQDHTIPIRRK